MVVAWLGQFRKDMILTGLESVWLLTGLDRCKWINRFREMQVD